MKQEPLAFLSKISFIVGYDVNGDDTASSFLEDLIGAAIEDMELAGVDSNIINVDNKLVVSCISNFVVDNLNLTPGNYKTSSQYISLVHKLRTMIIPLVEES